MYSAVPTQPTPATQQHVVTLDPHKSRSTALIVFGVIQLIVSLSLFAWCVWIVTEDNTIIVTYLAIFSCVYHVVLSIIAIIGGGDVVSRRILVAACMGVAIFGVVVVTSCTWVYNFMSWAAYNFGCNNCHKLNHDFKTNLKKFGENIICTRACNNIAAIFLAITIFVALQGLLDIIIASINCCNICECCGASTRTGTYVVQPQTYTVVQSQTYPPGQTTYPGGNQPYSYTQSPFYPQQQNPYLTKIDNNQTNEKNDKNAPLSNVKIDNEPKATNVKI